MKALKVYAILKGKEPSSLMFECYSIDSEVFL